MTRETKIGLLVGLAFIIVIGILLSDHMASTTEPTQAALDNAAATSRTAIVVPNEARSGAVGSGFVIHTWEGCRQRFNLVEQAIQASREIPAAADLALSLEVNPCRVDRLLIQRHCTDLSDRTRPTPHDRDPSMLEAFAVG